ncbi:MAG: cell division protein ZipA [Gammaproteobacteria bacterium]|nr:cell division protein ZipA [Pseudomonadales bacterium]MCP5346384.1 cell division protein ZipA [Pseudomonadales bacterium]
MGTRELLILILGLAVVAVILRGLYVAIHARRRQIRLAIEKNIPQDIDLEELELAELPSGGARVIKRSLAEVNQQNALQSELDLDSDGDPDTDAVPILLDTVEIRQEPRLTVTDLDIDEEEADGARHPARQQYRDYGDSRGADTAEADCEGDAAGNLDDEEEWHQSDASSHDDLEDEIDADAESWSGNEQEEEQDEQEVARHGDGQRLKEAAELEDAELDGDEEVRQEHGFELEDDLDDDLVEDSAEESEDEFDDFSLSAGDRIGAPEAMQGRESRKGSLFSRFGRKDSRSDSDWDDEDYGPTLEEDNDPLFRDTGRVTPNRENSRLAGAVKQAPREEWVVSRATTQERAEAGRTARPTARDERRASRQAPESAGVTDFNQARESRRPTGVGSQGSAAPTATGRRQEFEPSEVLVINVMSHDDELFRGPDLLQVMLAAGLKHGDMNIFHRHLGSRIDSPVIFSVANILNPGTFDLDNIEEFETRGVSLFLAMPAVISNREAFEDMLRTAQQLRAALDGELRDDRRSVMTAQTIEHYRQRIQDYELRKLKAAQAQS